MSRSKADAEPLTGESDYTLEDSADAEEWERAALEELEPGVYEIDATEIEETVDRDDRLTPGIDVKHGKYDIISVAEILEYSSAREAFEELDGDRQRLESHLEENYPEEEFLGIEDEDEGKKYKVAAVQSGDRVLLRACYVCD